MLFCGNVFAIILIYHLETQKKKFNTSKLFPCAYEQGIKIKFTGCHTTTEMLRKL